MSEEEVLEKFRDCLDYGLGAARADADRLAEAIMHIDSAGDAGAAIVAVFPQANC